MTIQDAGLVALSLLEDCNGIVLCLPPTGRLLYHPVPGCTELGLDTVIKKDDDQTEAIRNSLKDLIQKMVHLLVTQGIRHSDLVPWWNPNLPSARLLIIPFCLEGLMYTLLLGDPGNDPLVAFTLGIRVAVLDEALPDEQEA